MVDFEAGAPVSGDLDVRWNHGARPARRDTDQPIQVHAYDEHTFVLRQNMAVHYEAPFLYLLFGNKRALLLDTGATADSGLFPLRGTVDALVAKWLAEHPRTGYELIVVHSHAHSDHVAGIPSSTAARTPRSSSPTLTASSRSSGFRPGRTRPSSSIWVAEFLRSPGSLATTTRPSPPTTGGAVSS